MQSLGVGFSFAGKHCDDMQCELGNNDESMHSFMENFAVVSENLEGYDGAYYVGETVKEKDFNIKLFVEEVADDVLARIGHWMRRGAHGKLIFDHAPYKYYNVQVSAPMDVSGLYTKFNLSRQMFVYSGVIGVKLTAYTPYAYLLDEVKSAYPNVGDMLNTLNASSAIMAESERPSVEWDGNSNTMIIANLGNAYAKPDIHITGKFPTGTAIINKTTGQQIVINDDGVKSETYIISSQKGLTERIINASENTRETADTVKNGTFITLIPSFPDEIINYSVSGGKLISAEANESMIGKYVRYKDEWKRIKDVTDNVITLDNPVAYIAETSSKVMLLNEIEISIGTEDTLEGLYFEYRDTFY